jgi:hypothetical protein
LFVEPSVTPHDPHAIEFRDCDALAPMVQQHHQFVPEQRIVPRNGALKSQTRTLTRGG